MLRLTSCGGDGGDGDSVNSGDNQNGQNRIIKEKDRGMNGSIVKRKKDETTKEER